MLKVIEAIQKIYPSIQGGYVYWYTKQCGTPWENPIDGLVWENTEFEKPTWEQIEAQFSNVELEQVRAEKIAQCKSYLNATDKYFIEASERETPDYAQKATRQIARNTIIMLKACTTLEELNAINTDFS